MDISSGPVMLSKKRGGLAADVSSGLIFLKKKQRKDNHFFSEPAPVIGVFCILRVSQCRGKKL